MKSKADASSRVLREILGLDKQGTVDIPASVDAQIRAHFLSNVQPVIEGAPSFISILGGPGSGKSYFFEMMRSAGDLPDNGVVHDPDSVMQMIPQYQSACQVDPVGAFNRWEPFALQLSHEILYQAIQLRSPVIYQRTLGTPEAMGLLRFVKKFGYYLKTYVLMCHKEVAISRTLQRAHVIKRSLPEQVVIKRHALFMEKLPEVKQLSDEYDVYHNHVDGRLPVRACDEGELQ